MTTLFLSDTHLGNKHSKIENLLRLLERNNTRNLVLVGDTFDDHYELPFTKGTVKVMEHFLAFEKVLVVPGNHDKWIKKFIDYTMPFNLDEKITVALETIMMIGQKKFLITHGDLYDWSMMFAISSRTLRKLSTDWQWIHKHFTGHRSSFVKRVVKRAKELNCEGVICGHSHQPLIKRIEGVLYINCGDWFVNCTGVLEKDGEFKLVNAL